MFFLRFFFLQFKHRRRYNKIIFVLIKYGFDDYVNQMEKKNRMAWLLRLIPQRRKKAARLLTRWEKMRKVCEELGPTFIKFGQLLSNRPDLIPTELAEELEKLQDSVPSFSSFKANAILREELGEAIDNSFTSISEAPIASASIAQVHSAEMVDGKKIALKIQRPGIRNIIEQDLKIMYDFAKMLEERFPSVRSFDPLGLVKNFDHSIHQEMDFLHESINIRRFDYNFRDDPKIQAPKVVVEYSTSRVLCMELIDGIRVTQFDKLTERGQDRKDLARLILNSFFIQVFRHGFFQADPHPGNFLFTKEGILFYLDFGMMGTLLPRDKDQIVTLILAIEQQNAKSMMRALEELADFTELKNRKKLEYDINELVTRYAFTPDFHNQVSGILLEITEILIAHGLVVPSNFFLLIRALFSVEGLARKMDPDIQIYDEIRPHLVGLIERNRNPIVFGQKILHSAFELGNYLQEFPNDLRQTMRMIRKGKIQVNLEHKGVDPIIHTFNRISRQIAGAVITGSLIVGSSLIMAAKIPPFWGEVPILSLIGFSIATILGIGLILNLMKNDKGY